MPSKELARCRDALWARDPHCHWCGRLTRLIKREGGGKTEPDQATLDHIYTRFDEERLKPANGERRRVLACSECNFRRGVERQREQQLRGDPQAFNSDSRERRIIERYGRLRLTFQLGEVFQSYE